MIDMLRGMDLVDNNLLSEDTNDNTEGTDLADYNGYDVTNDISVELSIAFYGTGPYDENSYLYKHIAEKNPDNTLEENANIIKDKDSTIYAEAQAAFEKDIRDGIIGVETEVDGKKVIILDASQIGRNYAQPSENMINHYENSDLATREVVEGNGDGSLNAIVVNYNGKNIMLIEGSSDVNDKDDWPENIDLGLNGLNGNDFVPQVYTDSYNYYKDVSQTVDIDRIVGNSQAGGSAVYIGMNDADVDILAINPSPQIASTVKVNAAGNKNITIVYSKSDPLWNATYPEYMGFTTDIPGANIVFVEFGLDRLFQNELANEDLRSAHTGSVSAVDYDKDGIVSDEEAELGIVIDDVIPRNVFTGKEIGSNSDSIIVMKKGNMEQFAQYLRRLRENDLQGIVNRLERAKLDNDTVSDDMANAVNKGSITFVVGCCILL